ncbi:hypothetical protein [Actibacterium sp. 188UL27-1]|uniref:hypothetical protein n=1 Tax=Actibacterium sp. 188UL27-1 TaxID=2786961 RepID=UPI00195B2758|nr:hypothetical protein [Actibacterium sp. 188UL27-1]MBM7066007.1 hypothetical protein [Actibacterium sp. 188UL27-1]
MAENTLPWALTAAPTAIRHQPPRKRTGPVLMGDINAAVGDTPLLLLLWRQWEEQTKD